VKRGSSSYKNVLTVIPLQSYKTTKIVFNVYAIFTLLNRIEIIIICFIIPHFKLLLFYVVISFQLVVASDKVYQLLVHGRWFSPGTPASSTTKTGRHDIAEILLYYFYCNLLFFPEIFFN
jgi:hypothetical protein